METLRKLERVQGMLSFLQSRGISTGQPDSDRFLADFVLFLARSCPVNLEKRCQLIQEHLSTISDILLKEEPLIFSEEDYQEIYAEPSAHLCADKKSVLCSLNTDDELPLIGLNAMQRANSTLEDFVTNPQSIFKFLPVLSFTESYIYQLDIINEKSLQFSMDKLSTSGNYVHVGTQGDVTHVPPAFLSNPFDPLLFLLQQHGLLTKRIEEELKSGLEYWALERSLCHALISKEKILLEDVMRAIHLKSFDYRVLHLLLYQLRDEQVNELHMEFLSVSEFLVEISDDLYDYEDDVIENCFNVLRMLVGVYGPQMAPSILAKCISEAEEKYNLLFRSLDYGISSNYQRRCEEATREGGKTSGYTLGTWNIPCVVVDEDAYRSRNLNSNGPRHKPNHGFPTV